MIRVVCGRCRNALALSVLKPVVESGEMKLLCPACSVVLVVEDCSSDVRDEHEDTVHA